MPALRNLLIRALARSSPANRVIPISPWPRRDEPAGSLALVRAPSRALQIIPKTDETHGVTSMHRPVAGSVQLLHAEIDLKFLTVERIVVEQAASLSSLRDLALEFEAKMTCLSQNIEKLCENAVRETEMISDEHRAQMAKRKLEAVSALAEKSEPAPSAEPVHTVNCPNCLSQDTRPARRLSAIDKCLRAISLNPRRCRGCGIRFYRIRWAASVDLNKVPFNGIGKGPKAGESRSNRYTG